MKSNKRLPKCGLKVSELSLGTYFTVGRQNDQEVLNELVKVAIDGGINTFDTAEAYGRGQADIMLGKAIKASGARRSDYVITEKIYFGTEATGPNSVGLSRKHILEATQECLQRLDVPSIDIMYAHRYDEHTPLEETIRAFNHGIQQGHYYYWGTASWSVNQVQRAIDICDRLGLIPPVVEQASYNIFDRDIESLTPLKSEIGIFTYSALLSGLLTGKHKGGLAKGSRLDIDSNFKEYAYSKATDEKVDELSEIADQLECSLAQLSIGWCLKNDHVTSVLVGATSVKQLEENMKSIEVVPKLTDDIMEKIRFIAMGEEKETEPLTIEQAEMVAATQYPI